MSELDILLSDNTDPQVEDDEVCKYCGKVPCESFIGLGCSNTPKSGYSGLTFDGYTVTTSSSFTNGQGYYIKALDYDWSDDQAHLKKLMDNAKAQQKQVKRQIDANYLRGFADPNPNG